jgi:predicted metal-dependent phosphoesterase TrpH
MAGGTAVEDRSIPHQASTDRKMLTLEFHCHTHYSPDSLTEPRDLVARCRRRGVDRLVVTDHNTIAGARRAYELAPELIIIGEEIMTQQGELLAAFVQEEVPSGLPSQEAIRRLRDQGAFISVSHPFDTFRNGHWKRKDLEAIVPLIDAVEVFNARCLWPPHNAQARAFAAQHGLAGTAGSDAHALVEVGKATMILPEFEGASGFRGVVRKARLNRRLSAPWIHLASRYAVWVKRRRGQT